MNKKQQIRHEIIQKRKSLIPNEYKQKSLAICKKIIESSEYDKSNVIFCYSAVNNEVDLTYLINNALACKKKIAMPKVIGENIKFYFINSLEDLTPGYFKIPEPDTVCPAEDGDLIIVPGVAFSESGARLGYGGGFYDRFLSENLIYSIGAGFDFQIIKNLPLEEHDKKTNKVITD